MNHQTELEKVIDRVQKMLALSTSSEPHEAAAALRQAQKLMEKYNLDLGTVQMAVIEELVVKSRFSVSNVKPYEAKLMHTIADAFGCKLMWRSGSSHNQDPYGRFIFIGEKTQAKIATYTAEVMGRKLIVAKAKFTKELPSYYSRELKTKNIDGFCVGWVYEVTKMIHAFAGAPEMLALTNKYYEKNYPNTSSKKTQERKLGQQGYDAGIEAGSKESIQHGVGAGSQQARLAYGG